MDTREKISKLETRYTELKAEVDEAKNALRSKEAELLELLQELMPLQNAFLGTVINGLQARIRTLETEKPDQAQKNIITTDSAKSSNHADQVEHSGQAGKKENNIEPVM